MSATDENSPIKMEDEESQSNLVIEVEDTDEISNNNENFLQGKSVDEYFKKVMGLIKLCQKYSSDVQGWQNYSDYSGVNRTMTGINKQLSNMVSKVFIHQDIKLNINGYKLTDQFDIIREGNDALCERVNSDLDEASGIRREIDLEICDTTIRTIRGPVNQTTGREVILRASRNVQKPQMFFTSKINNSPSDPFVPLLKEKPNSMKPLSVMLCVDSEGREYYSHPYEYELQHWTLSDELLRPNKVVKPSSMDTTTHVWVDTEESLNSMIEELRNVKEIAVDLEHHQFRTYQGLTCLIQISSRQKDYIIDPFPVRNYLPALNEIFTHPKIAKVFHGADHDILWLQRDCGVYVVNMFDTHQAAIVLEYPHKSLAYLLSKFCSLEPDKSYQRSDWRIRPLPENFLYYARQDSHFLLYVYDRIKNELIEKGNSLNNLLCATYNRSTELCLKRYEKPIVGNDSHMDLYRRSKKIFNCRQLHALQQIYLWRDKLARQHDESVDYVLPKHMMLQMAEVLPKEMQGILACCNPIPNFVKTEKLTLHQILRAAREIPLDTMNTTEKDTITLNQMLDASDPLSSLECRYDLSLLEEESKGLGTLLNPQETLLGDLFDQNEVEVKEKKKSTLYGTSKILLGSMKKELSRLTEEYMSPFERYNISIEHERQQEDKEMEQKEKKLIAEQASDKARVDKIKDLFKSLSSGETISFEDTTDQMDTSSDQIRLERLQSHIASLTSTIRETVTNRNEEEISQKPLSKKKNKKNKQEKTNESPENSLKRRSTENGSDISSKKLRAESEEGNEQKEADMEEGEIEDEEEEIKPFDYANANYSVFKPKNQKKFKNRNIKEKYKMKGKGTPTGFRKASEKSMSWGGKG